MSRVLPYIVFCSLSTRMVPYFNGCKALCLLSACASDSEEREFQIHSLYVNGEDIICPTLRLFIVYLCCVGLLFASGSPPKSLGENKLGIVSKKVLGLRYTLL